MVPPTYRDKITSLLDMTDIEYDVMINDVQALIDEQDRARSRRGQTTNGFNYSVYHTYDEVSPQFRYDYNIIFMVCDF